MNKVEKWIEKHKTKRNNSWDWRINGYYIEDILPNTFECYAIIYHPYRLPLESLITNEEHEKIWSRQLTFNFNKLISDTFNIPMEELPVDKYDIECTIRNKVNKNNITEQEIETKLKELEKPLIKIALLPLLDTINHTNKKEKIEKRDAKWEEVFNFYNLPFNKDSSWYDTLGLDSKSKIFNSEMPCQDNIPISVLNVLDEFLRSEGVEKVNINSLSNTIGVQNLVHKVSEILPLHEIVNYDNIHIISSINNEWIFITPYDYCRTIVASTMSFISKLKSQTTLEISDFVSTKHRFNKMYTDNQVNGDTTK